MPNKKILVYCPVFLPDQSGYAHAFAALVQNLLEEGFNVDVLVPHNFPGEEVLNHPNLRIIRKTYSLNVWMIGLFYQYFRLAEFIFKLNRSENYSVIFVETGDHPLLLTFMREQLLHKTVVRFHSTSDTEYLLLGKQFKYKLKRWLWKLAAAPRIRNLCATNNYHLAFATEKVIGHANFMYSGVITNTIKTHKDAVKNTKPGKTFLMLGRMDAEGYRQKGFDILLEALPLIANSFELSHSRLVIIGDGMYHEEFKHQVLQYKFVELHRSLPHTQVTALLADSDVVVLPSLYEGVSVFALEALGYGNAVIFSNTGGLVNMVSDNGLLVEPGNALMLADALNKLVNTGELTAFKNNSLKLASEEFGSSKQMQQFYQMLDIISC